MFAASYFKRIAMKGFGYAYFRASAYYRGSMVPQMIEMGDVTFNQQTFSFGMATLCTVLAGTWK